MFGSLLNYEVKNQTINLEFEGANASVEVIADRIVRVFSGDKSITSKAIEGNKTVRTDVSVNKTKSGIEINTPSLKVCVGNDFKVDFFDKDGKCYCEDYRNEREMRTYMSEVNIKNSQEEFIKATEPKKHKIEVIKSLGRDECFYGLGDKSGFLNKRHYEYEMWNVDEPRPHLEFFKSLYKAIPFFIALKKDCCYGIFFDNTYKTFFDMGKESDNYYYFGADNGNLDYYFFGAGSMKEVLCDYTYLTGRMPLPQLWTLGYQQSRWSYDTEEELRALVKRFRDDNIPLDAVHLDIDYMERFKDFTWDSKKFPDFKKLLKDLEKDGVKIVTIIDAGVKNEDGYKVYEEGVKNDYFVKTPEGENYVNAVWPGDSCFPDFGKPEVQNWWADNVKALSDAGVRGIWNDMNEPATFNGPIPDDVVFSDGNVKTDHARMHNVYGMLMSKATYEGLKKHDGRRPFVITRACYSGAQKYTTVWTGDNHSIWAHLQMSIPQLCNLSLSGIGYAGADIGGFLADTTPELLVRWVEAACLTPLFRNHSELYSIRQEPWKFGKEAENIYRIYVRLRYKLIPYLYDLFYEQELSGLPVIRPLVLNYEHDEKVKNLNNEYMVGDSLIVAPVVEQGSDERLVYLPEGEFYDFWTGEKLEGGRSFIRSAPLDMLPLYVRAGSIIPVYPEQNYIGEKEIDTLELNIYPGVGSYSHYQDDGESFLYRKGVYNKFVCSLDGKQLNIDCVHNGFDKVYKNYRINCGGKTVTVPFRKGIINIDL